MAIYKKVLAAPTGPVADGEEDLFLVSLDGDVATFHMPRADGSGYVPIVSPDRIDAQVDAKIAGLPVQIAQTAEAAAADAVAGLSIPTEADIDARVSAAVNGIAIPSSDDIDARVAAGIGGLTIPTTADIQTVSKATAAAEIARVALPTAASVEAAVTKGLTDRDLLTAAQVEERAARIAESRRPWALWGSIITSYPRLPRFTVTGSTFNILE
ncbi:hypothetical protein [uncultured Jannaschia sp.]|uniref:hypothetical protein n=1 Tax=uncultured Jannaschia sp. TaxID=293347 RepID=UPI002628BB82|nr:hypothetical protein [uncultured Jannaschia sp.]